MKVIVVGAGVMGLCTAWGLAREGHDVDVMEQAELPNPLASERLLSSTLVGLVLGWVRWRTGSVLPGMLLHLCHNGVLTAVIYYLPDVNPDVMEVEHLPQAWLLWGGLWLLVGLALVWWSGGARGERMEGRGS